MNQRDTLSLPIATECGYHEHNRPCKEPPSCTVSLDGKRIGLCDRHRRPEFHPPDLHKKLPGRLARTLRGH